MGDNIVTAKFRGKSLVTIDTRYQYDYGQLLKFDGLNLPEIFETHFSNDETGESITQVGNNNVVEIPDQFFLTGDPIYAWVFVHDGNADGRTKYLVKINVKPRAVITDEEPTPQEQSAISQAIAAMNVVVDKANTALGNYPKIVDGTWRVYDANNGVWVDTGVEAEGRDGRDGMSPVISTTPIQNGTRLTIIDDVSMKTVDVMNGVNGINGTNGRDGKDGADGKDGRDGYTPVKGVDYTDGYTPVKGVDYFDGANGKDGKDGTDGVSPIVTVAQNPTGATIVITDASGTTSATVLNGLDGKDGTNGADGFSPTATVSKSGNTATISITDKNGTTTASVTDGDDAVSPSISVTDITGGHRVTITDVNGTRTFDVMDGATGATGGTGTTGATGADGFSPVANVSKSGTTTTITVTDKTGTTTASISDSEVTQAELDAVIDDVEEIQEIFSDTITSTKPQYSLNGYIQKNGKFVENQYNVATPFIPIKNVVDITIIGANVGSNSYGCAYYDAGFNFLGGIMGITTDTVIDAVDIPADTAFVRFGSRAAYVPETTIRSVQNVLTDIRDDINDMKVNVVSMDGTEVTINGVANTRYICGEVTSLTIYPPETGIIDVLFSVGSSNAVVTLPNTVKMPSNYQISLDTTYEINIMDGVYGAVMSWT